MLLAIRTQRDAATMVGLIAAATGLVTLYGCVRLAQGAPDSWMIYQRVGWPTGYPNTSASLGVLGFWTLVGVGAERRLAWPARSLALAAAVPAIGFALLTQSRGAALTLILVSPFAIALVRERLRLTAFTLVALAGLLPAIPALRTAIDTGSEADAGTAAARLLLGGVLVAAIGAAIAVADQRISISPERRRAARPRRCRGHGDRRRAAGRRRAAEGRAGAHLQRLPLVHEGRRLGRRRAAPALGRVQPLGLLEGRGAATSRRGR